MIKIFLSLIMIISIIILTRCTNDASIEEANKISKMLVKKGIISSSDEVIDKYVSTSCPLETCWNTTYYIHKDSNGNLKAINYEKVKKSKGDNNKCDFLVYIYDSVYEPPYILEYDNEEKYTIDKSSYSEYCIKEHNYLFFKTYRIKK